ncbi:hypothetical protein EJ05DRAFT_509959 [Pseudovirgaria hyperparasitica]|uniref:Myb-like domain-containing protein n=1 Tax=Pseudovirgaria hyperparasitica TaxID=470096 RepID=A0A6A6W8V1_9PEZI|nr:uncharacterized protein EJ05DRAFT_509959 [Pseudovirgaria hyperparasitica]KAF2759093.1 hypothetical protein EJ05DRAFT_509959 [Pseudovirgaria hyperparasitica]
MIDIQRPLSTMDSTFTTYHPFSSDLAMVLNEPYIPAIRSMHTPLSTSRLLPPIAPRPNIPGSILPHGETIEDSLQPTDRHYQIYLTSSRRRKLDLTEEDKFLLKLREEERLPWKAVAARFKSDKGKVYRVPALQMRLKRIKERVRGSEWPENDLRALRMSHDHWAQNRFEIIANKMTDFGVTQRWSAHQCARKWQEAEYDSPPQSYCVAHEDSPKEYALSEEPERVMYDYDHEAIERLSHTPSASQEEQWDYVSSWKSIHPTDISIPSAPLYAHETYAGV